MCMLNYNVLLNTNPISYNPNDLSEYHYQDKIIKVCSSNTPATNNDYDKLFQLECIHMKKLMLADSGLYNSLFPVYYGIDYAHDNSINHPFLLIDYVNGCTLSSYISRYNTSIMPNLCISRNTFIHLLKQINTAFNFMITADFINLDLSFGNIIITNNDFDIKLIDFTHSYYLNTGYYNNGHYLYKNLVINQKHKLINNFVNRKSPISVQIAQTGAIFILRLFYNNDQHFDNNFNLIRLSNSDWSSKVYNEVLDYYSILRNNPTPSKFPLGLWNDLYSKLLFILSK